MHTTTITGAPIGETADYNIITYVAPRGKNTTRDPAHKHAEAYAIMAYSTAVGPGETPKTVFVWNSRDGVTPFCIFIEGVEYTHTNWPQDRYAPNYKPTIGDYIFRDVQTDEALEFARKRLESSKDQPYYPSPEKYEDTLSSIAKSIAGGPMLAKVVSCSFTSESLLFL